MNHGKVVAFVADLMFSLRIEKVANHLNFACDVFEDANAFGGEPNSPAAPPGERLAGNQGGLFDYLTREQPALLIFDLGNAGIPWQRWIPALKSSPATRRIPILAYGAHVDVKTIQAAKSYGADEVVARSRFASGMVDLIQKLARLPDVHAIEQACSQPLSKLGRKGIDLYNRREFFDAHEELEHAWNEDKSAGRDFYRAILQIAVAYLQIERGNYNGAMKMALRVRGWLTPLPASCRGVDIDQLRQDVDNMQAALLANGAAAIDQFDWENIYRPIELN